MKKVYLLKESDPCFGNDVSVIEDKAFAMEIFEERVKYLFDWEEEDTDCDGRTMEECIAECICNFDDTRVSLEEENMV